MRAYVAQRGWIVVIEVRDVSSGAFQRPQREQLGPAGAFEQKVTVLNFLPV
jgi:hypothetical protein